ncbi:MAG: ABC transporter ATP-binding protein [Natronospirillum sp.]
MNNPILSLTNVHANIDQYHILHGVDLTVPEGELTVLLGRNGAGKSTTLRTIMGRNKVTKGSVRFRDEDITTLATPRIARKNIAFVPESMSIFSQLSVHENMLIAATSGHLDQHRLSWLYDLFPPLKRFWHKAAGNLSGGQKQMLAIARAMIEPRDLLLVDEPTKGLAPAIVDDLASAFEQLKSQRVSVLLVEQNFNFSRRLGESVAIMNDGRVVHHGAMAELAGDEALQQQHLGLGLGANQ